MAASSRASSISSLFCCHLPCISLTCSTAVCQPIIGAAVTGSHIACRYHLRQEILWLCEICQLFLITWNITTEVLALTHLSLAIPQRQEIQVLSFLSCPSHFRSGSCASLLQSSPYGICSLDWGGGGRGEVLVL